MKQLGFYFVIVAIAILFNACTSFRDEYKPLYQAKPQIESIKRTN